MLIDHHFLLQHFFDEVVGSGTRDESTSPNRSAFICIYAYFAVFAMWVGLGSSGSNGGQAMARLKRPLNGGPLYLRGAGSGRRGTWHISSEGEAWLVEHNFSLPSPGYEIFLSQLDLLRLEAHLYTFGIPYEHRQTLAGPLVEPEHKALPLFLRLGGKHETVAPWTLCIALSGLVETTRGWQGAHHPSIASVYVSGALSADPAVIPARQLQDSLCWPSVFPSTEPYRVLWQDKQGRMSEILPTPGLQTTGEGNIFVKRRDAMESGTWWQRRLPGESLSAVDCEEFYWLALPDYTPEWPARTEAVRGPFRGWQLWKLGLEKDIPIPWEMIEEWLDMRNFDLAYPSWRIRALNPLACADANQFTVMPGHPLLIRCDPPRLLRLEAASGAQVLLTVSPLSSLSTQLRAQPSSLVASPLLQPAREQYFALRTPMADAAYRIQLRGEATGTTLRVHVAKPRTVQPAWLHGFTCTLETPQGTRTLYAFQASPLGRSSSELRIPGDIAASQVSDLTFRLEPAGIPFSWEWEWRTSSGVFSRERLENLRTDQDFSSLWRERIWPACSAGSQSKLTLDAGAFGRIELLLLQPREDLAWWQDDRLASQCLWLSRVSSNALSARRTQLVPEPLRQWLQQSLLAPSLPGELRVALHHLLVREFLPLWVIVRLRIIVEETQHIHAALVTG